MHRSDDISSGATMRYLAVARFRLLTTIRSATPLFVLAVLPLLLALIVESGSESELLTSPDRWFPMNGFVALFAWVTHGALVMLAGEALGNLKLIGPDQSTPHSDLMDSAPVLARTRFYGESIGNLAAVAIIHICCLPLLALVAALSPLPTTWFLNIEAVIIALMILTGTGGAWKRLAPLSKWSRSRTVRNGLLTCILFLLGFLATTRWEVFREAVGSFFSSPTTRTWGQVTSSVEKPEWLVIWLVVLYAGNVAFYYLSSTRNRARA
jgi:hypothetical protein